MRRAIEEGRQLSLSMNAGSSPAHPGATATASGSTPEAETAALSSEALRDIILTTLDDNKAEDLVQIDLRGKSSMGDHMVIGSGRSARQVAALAEKLVAVLKADHGRSARIEGKDAGDWVLIDTGDVIVHLFRPEVRDFYQLEKMWLAAGETGARPT
jgi:ribosome-associated protein